MKKLTIIALLAALTVIAVKHSRQSQSEKAAAIESAVIHEVPSSPNSVSQIPDREIVVGKEVLFSVAPLKKTLVDFYLGSQKAIVTKNERARMNQLMADRQVIDQAFERLKTPETTFEKNNEFERMNAIYFISQALEWKKNPSRPYLVALAKTVVLEYKTQPQLPLRLQKSRAADRVEIYKSIIENDPETAAQIEREGQNSDASKIIKFTKGFYS